MKVRETMRYLLAAIAVCCAVYSYLILFPQVLFKNKFDYRNFSIYSNDPIDRNMRTILDNCIAQLQTSEIYDSTEHQKIFFIHDSFYYTMTKGFSIERAGYHEFLINNTMIVPAVDTRNNTLTYADGRVRNLAQTIIHETVHSLQERKLGFWGVIKIPEWKLEGYAFYISKTNDVLNKHRLSYKYVRQNLDDLCNHPTCKHYWVYGVLTAYILNEKQYSFEHFYEKNVKQDTTIKEVVDWYLDNSCLSDEHNSLY